MNGDENEHEYSAVVRISLRANDENDAADAISGLLTEQGIGSECIADWEYINGPARV